MNAGCGYAYLMRSVATNDGPSDEPSLAKYYQAKGTPQGRWIGSGVAGFASKTVLSGSLVDEHQMAALYGEGLHPDADAMMQDGKKVSECQLGRRFPSYTNSIPVLEEIRDQERKFQQDYGRIPTVEERSEIAMSVGTKHFWTEFGVPPAHPKEVIEWVNKQKDSVQQAVGGYDFTFSPHKSVSVLWALSDETTSQKIAALHHKAVAKTLEWAEGNVIRTRVGAGGIHQVKTKGLIASEFTHFDTRAGDPDLHSHVLVSNKVQCAEGEHEGKWLSLDGRTIFDFHQSLSWRYDSILNDLLTQEMGLEFVETTRGEGKEAVWEVAGIDQRLIDSFSKRRDLARPVFDEKVTEYTQRTGLTPNRRMIHALWQEAILDTRDAKKQGQSLGDLRQQWADEVAELPDSDALLRSVDQALSSSPSHDRRPVYTPDEHADQLKREALSAVLARRATFKRSHVLTAVAGKMNAYRFDGQDRDSIHDIVTDQIISEYGLSLNGSDRLSLPQALVARDGKAVDRVLNDEEYTTLDTLNKERHVLDSVDQVVPYFAMSNDIEDAFSAHERQHGWPLNDGQKNLVRFLLTRGTLSAVGVGPAGTGKTSAMRVVADVWKSYDRQVITLAPSAAAAEVLGDDTGTTARTIDSLVFTWNGNNPHKPGHDLSALHTDIRPGDMMLVDESGMVSTDQMNALVEIAEASGAILRFVGDHKQLGSVENGGLFGAMATHSPSAELTEVMRFGKDSEQATSSMKLRKGDVSGIDLYEERGLVRHGSREAMIDTVVADHLADRAAGRRAMVIATRNDDVDKINLLVRSDLVARGEVSDEHTVTGNRGSAMGVGDTILARRNSTLDQAGSAPTDRILNGDLLRLDVIHSDGSITATHAGRGESMWIPADYVAEHMELGYASTVHRSQGSTVDVSRCVVDSSMDQAGLYVGMTRGKHVNAPYVVTDLSLDEGVEDGHLHHSGDEDAPTARDILEHIVTNDRRELSAHETMWNHDAHSGGSARRAALWEYGQEMAIRSYIDEIMPSHYDLLPPQYQRQLDESEDGDRPIRSALREYILDGNDPADVLPEVFRHCDGSEDVARVIAARIRTHLGNPRGSNGLPPATPNADRELLEWLEENQPDAPQAVDVAPGEVLDGRDLSNCDFSGQTLKDVTFTNCVLDGARFAGATLEGVTFADTTANGADFSGAALTKTTIRNTRLTNSTFSNAELGRPFKEVSVIGSDLSDTDFTDATLRAVVMRTTDLSAATMNGTNIGPVSLAHCTLDGARGDASTTVHPSATATECTGETNVPLPTSHTDDPFSSAFSPETEEDPLGYTDNPPEHNETPGLEL